MDRSKFYDSEKRLIINLITDSEFCATITPLINPEYFTNEYSRTIAKWVLTYYNDFGKAPGSEIIAVFERNADKLKPDQRDIIASVLEHLSNVEDSQQQFDTQHSIALAREFFQKRLVSLTATTALQHLDNGRLRDAVDLMGNYQDIDILNNSSDCNWFDKDLMTQSIDRLWHRDVSANSLLTFPGEFGEFIGPLEKSQVVCLSGPAKRGKSFYLMECALWAARMRLNTCFVSLEMNDSDMAFRSLTCMTGVAPGVKDNTRRVSIFDCALNQSCTCQRSYKPQETKNNRAFPEHDKKDKRSLSEIYTQFEKHVPCTFCRKQDKLEGNFKPTVWFTEVTDTRQEGAQRKRVAALEPLIKPYLKTQAFPINTATVDTLESHMNQLSKHNNWDCQVLVLDYASLLRGRNNYGEYRLSIADIWADLKSLAQSRNILIITAAQLNRSSMSTDTVQSDQMGESLQIVQIADLLIGLNQTKQEKEDGVLRMNYMDSRHNAQFRELLCLQDLSRSQALLDSAFARG